MSHGNHGKHRNYYVTRISRIINSKDLRIAIKQNFQKPFDLVESLSLLLQRHDLSCKQLAD